MVGTPETTVDQGAPPWLEVTVPATVTVLLTVTAPFTVKPVAVAACTGVGDELGVGVRLPTTVSPVSEAACTDFPILRTIW